MVKVTAAMVKELRQITDAPMMECKKALVEAEGDLEKAIDVLRVNGLAKAVKKAGRDTNEGTIGAYISEDGKVGALVEVSCETDFVATNAKFKGFVNSLAKVVAENDPADIDALMACPMNDGTVDEALKESIFVIGENQKIVRFARVEAANGALACYIHHDGKHADIVEFELVKADTATNDTFKTFAHDVAMQIIASDPISARREDIPEEVIEHEKEIYRAQAAESGRPEKFWEGIINGRLKKFFQERALTEQVFVKDGNMTVAELAAKVSNDVDDDIKIISFVRFNFGEE
ncbi:MAG: translation elongation factor Ts [Atopobiaceae bacterium]|nr:translation elongation factor Ts [Atopobiaceae bacterium]